MINQDLKETVVALFEEGSLVGMDDPGSFPGQPFERYKPDFIHASYPFA